MSMSNKHSNRRSYNAISQVSPIYSYFILLLYKHVHSIASRILSQMTFFWEIRFIYCLA